MRQYTGPDTSSRSSARTNYARALREIVLGMVDSAGPVDLLGLMEAELLLLREEVVRQLIPEFTRSDPGYEEDPNPVRGLQLREVERRPTPQNGEINRDHVAIVLPYFQRQLESVRKLRVGFVGLGSSQICCSMLARSGVEEFVLVDGDRFEASNVRQEFCSSATLGEHKVHATARQLRSINADIRVSPIPERATVDNIEDLLRDVDIVFSGVDNYASRILVDAYCKSHNKPLLAVAFAGWEGRYFASLPGDPDWANAVKGSRPTPNYGTHPVGIAMLWSFAANDALKWATGEDSLIRYPLMLCVNLLRLSPAVVRDARNVYRPHGADQETPVSHGLQDPALPAPVSSQVADITT